VYVSRHLFFLAILLLSLSGPALSQTPEEIDRQTVEVNSLLDRAESISSDLERENLARQALKLSKDLRYDGGTLRALLMLADLTDRSGRKEEALKHYLEAEEKLQNRFTPGVLLNVYRKLGDLFYRDGLFDIANRYYVKALELKPDDWVVMEKAGDAFLQELRFDSAETIYKTLVTHYRQAGNLPHVVQVYQKLATAYERIDNTGKSLYYYLLIEDIIEREGVPPEKGVMYNNLGRQYARLKDYAKALEYFKKAELQCVYIECDYMEVLYANLGIAYHNTGETSKGLPYLQKAHGILTARRDRVSLANLEHLMAGVYLSAGDLYNALKHNNIAIDLARETQQRQVLVNAYKTAADVYLDLFDFEKALEYFRLYLQLMDTIREQEQEELQQVNRQRTLLAAAEGQIKYLIAQQNFKDLELQQARYEQERLRLEIQQKEGENLLLAKQQEVDQAKIREQGLQALQDRQKLRLAVQQRDAERQNRVILDLRQREIIERAQAMADSASQAQEVKILRSEKELADFELSQQAIFNRFATGVGILLLVIAGLLGGGWWFGRQTNRRLAEERGKSDRLLLNILPGEVAQELKSHGYATPRHYPSVTIVFTDFANFTLLSSQLSPEKLIEELDDCFLAFDEISDRHGLEKIKTIGDAFMCAGGLPVPNETHPRDAVQAALAMFEWLEERRRSKTGATFLEMRVGIHTGPVVAGVVGKNKFAYDIWGDAVNLAARLEEHGEPGRINISRATYEAVKDQFECTFRGEKEVHNKGKVEMYFVEGPLPPASGESTEERNNAGATSNLKI
jgi:adenylate cyclase